MTGPVIPPIGNGSAQPSSGNGSIVRPIGSRELVTPRYLYVCRLTWALTRVAQT